MGPQRACLVGAAARPLACITATREQRGYNTQRSSKPSSSRRCRTWEPTLSRGRDLFACLVVSARLQARGQQHRYKLHVSCAQSRTACLAVSFVMRWAGRTRTTPRQSKASCLSHWLQAQTRARTPPSIRSQTSQSGFDMPCSRRVVARSRTCCTDSRKQACSLQGPARPRTLHNAAQCSVSTPWA